MDDNRQKVDEGGGFRRPGELPSCSLLVQLKRRRSGHRLRRCEYVHTLVLETDVLRSVVHLAKTLKVFQR